MDASPAGFFFADGLLCFVFGGLLLKEYKKIDVCHGGE